MTIGLVMLWSLAALLFGTAVVSIREASRTRLIEEMKRLGRGNGVEEFDRHEREYVRTALIHQQAAFLLFVLTISFMVPSGERWFVRPLCVLLISAVWLLVVGVAVPTAWGRHAGESYIARALPLLELLRRLTRPLLMIVNTIDEIVRRLAGAPQETDDRTKEMEREILDAVTQAETSGAVDKSEKAMIKSVMVLDQTSVDEVMTPRTDMVGIESTARYEEVRDLVLTKGHSRIPVYEEAIDHIVGILYAKDLLGIHDPKLFSLRDMVRSVPFVPETKDLASLLREFQADRVHMAIVLDEYGGTAGLVTIEDILEELVGDITDEHEQPPVPPISRIDETTVELDARVRVEEVNEELEINLPEDEDYDTIGGYVFSKLGRIPTAGEDLVTDNVKLEILEAEERSISRLRIHVLEPSEDG
ncbi:MAG: HlyC/CorC family transporter [Phycisphaerae bacterium]|nr:HlyC/CorC family transporter [Phycisphaerae bacterium]